jgi:hypothetical protein
VLFGGPWNRLRAPRPHHAATNTLIHEVAALIRLRRNARAAEVAHRIDPAALAALPSGAIA